MHRFPHFARGEAPFLDGIFPVIRAREEGRDLLQGIPRPERIGYGVADCAFQAIGRKAATPARRGIPAVHKIPGEKAEGPDTGGIHFLTPFFIAGNDSHFLIEYHQGFFKTIQVFAEGNAPIFGDESVATVGAKDRSQVRIGVMLLGSNNLTALRTEDLHRGLPLIENLPLSPLFLFYYPSIFPFLQKDF